MWNTFLHNNENYVIKFSNNPFKICLSNILNLWSEELTTEQIIERCKVLNPLLDIEDELYLPEVINLLNNIGNGTEIIINKEENESIELKCSKRLASTCFKFSFSLKLCDNLIMSKEFVVPLIQTIQYLEKRQNYLCDLLSKKDEEIQQHVFENGTLKRESVITNTFNQNEFIENASKIVCCNIFSKSDDYNKSIIEKYGCCEPELLLVKKEEIKKGKKNKMLLSKRIIKQKRNNIIVKKKKEEI